MSQILLASAIAAQSFFAPNVTEAERYEKLQKHFSPPPGGIVQINKDDIANKRGKDPFLFPGVIKIDPPKGYCFVITRTEETEDVTVCSKQELSFTMKQLDASGKLTWNIAVQNKATGRIDFTQPYVWKSNHRVAQAIDAGKRDVKLIPIYQCIAQRDKEQRRIILEMMNGQRWAIVFPDKDKASTVKSLSPNLYMPGTPTQVEVAEDGSEKKVDANKDAEKPKPNDPVTKHWAISLTNSFVMPSSNFRVLDDTPPGMRGSCRYRYRGAVGDVESGQIECHETDIYDVILAPLSCMKNII